MTDFTPAPSRRRLPDKVDAKHKALALIRPYAKQFENWNRKAAFAAAIALSHVTSPEERAEQEQLLSELCREVDELYEDFETAVAGETGHSRIDDLRHAFERLRSNLSQWRKPNH